MKREKTKSTKKYLRMTVRTLAEISKMYHFFWFVSLRRERKGKGNIRRVKAEGNFNLPLFLSEKPVGKEKCQVFEIVQ